MREKEAGDGSEVGSSVDCRTAEGRCTARVWLALPLCVHHAMGAWYRCEHVPSDVEMVEVMQQGSVVRRTSCSCCVVLSVE